MKAYFTVFCLLTINTIFAISAHQAETYVIEDQAVPLFRRYFAKCHKYNAANQRSYLQNASREMNPSSNNMTILDLDPPAAMLIKDVVERVLYGDADVVYLRNTSTSTASHLYEMLQQNYTHFIYIPDWANGAFIASKYPLSQAIIAQLEQENILNEEAEENVQIPILLVDLPCTLTVLKSLSEKVDLLSMENFEILPVRRGKDKDNDSGGGAYGGGKVNVEFGPGGPEWKASAYGGYEDERGNFAEVEVKRNEEGKNLCRS